MAKDVYTAGSKPCFEHFKCVANFVLCMVSTPVQAVAHRALLGSNQRYQPISVIGLSGNRAAMNQLN